MRGVVYALLAANLALLAWNLHGRATAPAVGARPMPAPSAAERETLPLLSELGDERLRARPTRIAAAAPGDDDSAMVAVEAHPEPAVALPSSPPSAAEDREQPGQPQASASPSPALASPVEPGPPARDVAPLATADRLTDPAPAEAEGTRDGTRTCMTLGPLEKGAPLRAIRDWLEERGAAVDVRLDERREVALYWVFFPPRASREDAIAEVVRMKAQGIRDVIVVPKGDMANAISLGVYSRTESRDRRLRELHARGYQPSIGPRYRTRVASWIDVSADTAALDTAAVESRWPDLRVTPTSCPETVAEAPVAPPVQASAAAPEAADGVGESPAAPAPAPAAAAESPRPLRRSGFPGTASEQ